MKIPFPRLVRRFRSKTRPTPAASLTELATKAADPLEASLQALGRSRKAQVAPALLLATGAGVAFWWWTQWARGSAESDAAGESEPPSERGPGD